MFNKLVTKTKKLRYIRSQVPVSLRTRAGEIYYEQAKKMGASKPLVEEERLKQWQYWALIDNSFPYSAAFKTHHMLIPKRVTTEQSLRAEERKELKDILYELSDQYDCHMTNFSKKQSIKNHYHIHLLTYKDSRESLSWQF